MSPSYKQSLKFSLSNGNSQKY